jgi:CRP-like cAMP-binding protein
LVNVSRVQLSGDEDAAAGDVIGLPNDETSAATRSQWVFYTLTGPGRLPTDDDGGGRAVLDVSRLGLAMDMCGLDGDTCSNMYALSKWAKRGSRAAQLDVDEFVALIERFSRPARLRDQLRRRVHEYAASRGLRTVDAEDGDRGQWSTIEDAWGTDRAVVLRGWDDILNGLRYV